MTPLTVKHLFETHSERLALRWLDGHSGGGRVITPDENYDQPQRSTISYAGQDNSQCEISPNKTLVGHLNLIHPNHVQVIGYTEIQYLLGLREISLQDALRQLFSHDPDCIVIAENQTAPEALHRICEKKHTALFSSPITSDKLVDELHYYLTNYFHKIVTLHGVYMEVLTMGVLLTGKSGVGKSELALELISRGHRLVADDAPEFARIAPDTINGTCPLALQDFLEVRGLGIINVKELFGAGAVKGNKFLRLIIELERLEQDQLTKLDRLAGSYQSIKVLDLDIPQITLPVAPGRNLAVLVECAARNHILRMSGYFSSEEFIERQRNLIEGEGG